VCGRPSLRGRASWDPVAHTSMLVRGGGVVRAVVRSAVHTADLPVLVVAQVFVRARLSDARSVFTLHPEGWCPPRDRFVFRLVEKNGSPTVRTSMSNPRRNPLLRPVSSGRLQEPQGRAWFQKIGTSSRWLREMRARVRTGVSCRNGVVWGSSWRCPLTVPGARALWGSEG
jgi:hypothetical protein